MRRVAIAALLLCACSSNGTGHFVRFTVDNIPGSTTEIAVFAALSADAAPPVTYPVKDTSDGQTFVLEIPNVNAWLTATIVARDSNGCDQGIIAGGLPNQFAGSIFDETIDLFILPGTDCGVSHTPGMYSLADATYTLGCTTTTDPDCATDESPVFSVEIPAFELAAEEITVGAYTDCVNANVCTAASEFDDVFGGPLPPTSAQNGLSWDQANQFCTWQGQSLPTEAQWEGAMRNASANLYPWGDDPPDCNHANYAPTTTTQCLTIDQNALIVERYPEGITKTGFFDGGGNVSEWTADFYAPRSDFDNTSVLTGPAAGNERVTKGGSIQFLPIALRAASRIAYMPDGTFPGQSSTFIPLLDTGARCAKTR